MEEGRACDGFSRWGLHSVSPLFVSFDVYMFTSHFFSVLHQHTGPVVFRVLSVIDAICLAHAVLLSYPQGFPSVSCLFTLLKLKSTKKKCSSPWPLSLLADGIYLGGIYQGVNVLMSFPCPLLQALMSCLILTKESHASVQQHNITYCILYHYWYNGCFVLFLSP